MKNSNYFFMLLLFIFLGVLLGIVIVFYNNINSIYYTQKDSNLSYSEKIIETIDISSGEQNTNTQIIHTEELIQQPEKIKSIYLTGWTVGLKNKRQTIIQNLKNHGFNAVVIDIKDEAGNLSYNSTVQTAIDISASKNMISNIKDVLEEFHNENIYVIGRIVTFKDPNYAKKITDNAYKKADGSLWYDFAGNNWPNPYDISTWYYPIELAKEAATIGFDEIQFDYVRFPSSEGKIKNISYGFDSQNKSKSQVINDFLKFAMSELQEYNVIVSADVFGITTKKAGDFEHIGQDFNEIAKIVDVICPMIYPSHYGYGEYGIKSPDKEPYKIIYSALQDAKKQYSANSGDVKLATIRPYLQDFTASWLKKGNYILYDTKAVTAQLQACYDLGIHDFTLWDPNNKYAFEALNNICESYGTSGDISENNIF